MLKKKITQATILVHPGLNNPEGGLNGASSGRLKVMKSKLLEKKLKNIPPDKLFFVSTVRDKDSKGVSQAMLIKHWLLANGIFPSQIFITEQSHNTWEDIRNSFLLVKRFNLPQPVFQASNTNHVWPRIWMIATFWGMIYGVKSEYVSTGRMNFRNSVRELFADGKAILMILKSAVKLSIGRKI